MLRDLFRERRLANKVAMVVGYPDSAIDLSPLLESICNQKHGDIEGIILSERPDTITGTVENFCKRMEAKGCTLVVTDSHEQVFSTLSRCDYLCFPDPESILNPDFTSTMTGFLEKFAEYNAARCNGMFVDERDMDFMIAPLIDISRHHQGDILDSLIAKETSINTCTWMIRAKALAREIIKDFPGDSIHWDWKISLASAHKNQVGFIDENLVKLVHRPRGPMSSILTNYEERNRIEKNFTAACLDTIEGLDAQEDEKSTWRKIAKIVSIKNRIAIDRTFRQWSNFVGYRDELSRILEECNGDAKSLVLEPGMEGRIDFVRTEDATGIFAYHYSNLLLLVLMKRLHEDVAQWILMRGFGVYRDLSKTRRFIVYGAGAAAKGILSTFLVMGFCPEFIWDKSARPGQTLWGIPVTTPELSTIPEHERKETEIIVAIGHRSAAQEVRRHLNDCGFHRVIHVAEPEGVRMYFQNLIETSTAADTCPVSADRRMSHGI